ncbi:MAG: hypothetical protein FD134_646 [Gallionellaceae bacterium]|nr:MAG: hypothetical protein FD134_646 [Gallionellaceae bacterium]
MAHADFNPDNPKNVFKNDSKLIELGNAILSEDLGRIKLLINQNHELLNGIGLYQITPLMFATLNQRPRAIDLLIRLGADPFQVTSEEANLGSPISFALRATKGADLLTVMLKAGASIEGGRDGLEEPLLFSAIMLPRDQRLKQLIAAGANLNIADSVGATAVINAVDSFQYEKAELLLQHGANPFLGRDNILVSLIEDHNKWATGTPNDLGRRRLIARLREMGMTEETVMQPAPTREQLRSKK